MKVTITFNGEQYEIEVDEAVKVCREIHEQLYPVTKENK